MVDGAAGAGHTTAASWRELIRQAVDVLWPGLPDGAAWIEAQVQAESAGDPRAVSPAGAQGLLQLMPGTAAEVGVANPFDPAENIRGGVTYLRRQYDALRQVPEHGDRLCWAFASYNAGRAYSARALALAEMDKALPGADRWWRWSLSWRYLLHRDAGIPVTPAPGQRRRWADHHQVVAYVARIQRRARTLGAVVETWPQ